MNKFIKPFSIYLLLVIIILAYVTAVDLQNVSQSRSNYFESTLLDTIFLAEYSALPLMLLIVGLVKAFRRTILRWLMATIFAGAFIFLGVCQYYNGNRIKTEVDGQAAIRYGCYWGEMYKTVSRNELLCVLKEIPTAMSNLGIYIDPGEDSYDPEGSYTPLTFLVGQAVIGSAFIIGKRQRT